MSSISRMPAATPDMTELGLRFLAATDKLVSVVASEQVEAEDLCEWIAHQSFRLSLSSLSITRGAVDGRLGKALLPISARMLFEDGARWYWLPYSAANATTGESLRALVNDGGPPSRSNRRSPAVRRCPKTHRRGPARSCRQHSTVRPRRADTAADRRDAHTRLSEPVRHRLGASDLRRTVTVRARHANLDPASQARQVPVGVRARLRDRDGGHSSRIRTHRVDHSPTGRTQPRFHPRAPPGRSSNAAPTSCL